jgi:hypothetical protein
MLWVKNGVYISCTYTMPLISDGEVFDAIRNLCPSARILLVSGFARARAADEMMK